MRNINQWEVWSPLCIRLSHKRPFSLYCLSSKKTCIVLTPGNSSGSVLHFMVPLCRRAWIPWLSCHYTCRYVSIWMFYKGAGHLCLTYGGPLHCYTLDMSDVTNCPDSIISLKPNPTPLIPSPSSVTIHQQDEKMNRRCLGSLTSSGRFIMLLEEWSRTTATQGSLIG